MSVRIFISHSVAPQELAIVAQVADVATNRGAEPIIAYRDWSPEKKINARSHIATQIRSSDYLIAIATLGGQHLEWVNQELDYNLHLQPPKPVLIIVDEGIPVTQGYGYDVIFINRRQPFLTLALVGQRIQQVVKDKATQQILQGFLIGGLALMFLALVGKGK